jgi:hypothetical protein
MLLFIAEPEPRGQELLGGCGLIVTVIKFCLCAEYLESPTLSLGIHGWDIGSTYDRSRRCQTVYFYFEIHTLGSDGSGTRFEKRDTCFRRSWATGEKVDSCLAALGNRSAAHDNQQLL